MPRVKEFQDIQTDSSATVRVYDVYTPSDEFNGLRAKVEFRHGRATLYEPKKADFKYDSDYDRERDGFRDIMDTLRRYGYTIKYRDVVTTAAHEIEDPDALDESWTED